MDGHRTRRGRTRLLLALFALACVGLGALTGRMLVSRGSAPSPSPEGMVVEAADNRRLMEGSRHAMILYSQPACVASAHARDWLTRHGVDFEERVIEESNAPWREAKAMDARMTPFMVTATHRIQGFDPARMDELAGDLQVAH
ncbi:glutaredoxin family protein [Luteimonas huabeiensis]|uniref:glutaredoxin family protein n=1 Tax=Luteimonas huabeiensis TaxID=1244513 RepID=UPI0004640549|nr:glutaredoxin domain-containing protein [Luteimonas huabeiensis]